MTAAHYHIDDREHPASVLRRCATITNLIEAPELSDPGDYLDDEEERERCSYALRFLARRRSVLKMSLAQAADLDLPSSLAARLNNVIDEITAEIG